MGYVKFTESVGDISKTYEFGSYEDFKDWENKISGILVSAEEEVVKDAEGWIKNIGLRPNLPNDTLVQVKFKDGSTAESTVNYWVWSLCPDFYQGDIDLYRVIDK